MDDSTLTDRTGAQARDPLLFTPGPLNTSPAVKQTMTRDLGSRDTEFLDLVRDVRRHLLAVAGAGGDEFTAVPVQGSGTYALEAVLSSVMGPDDQLLVVENGHYGRRLERIARAHRVPVSACSFPEDLAPRSEAVAAALGARPDVTHVAMVHCETSTGMVNPVAEIAAAVGAGRCLIVDAMSSFGALALDLQACRVDYLVSSANKCLEGVPGLAFVIARLASLLAAAGRARTLSLDLYDQWRYLEEFGQFRFTPPVQVVAALRQALMEHEAEGGLRARAARYEANYRVVSDAMRAMGFREYLPPAPGQHIITSYHVPSHPRFHFGTFYDGLRRREMVIYPGKVTDAACFRIGHIGRIGVAESEALVAAVRAVLSEMGIPVPLT